MKHNRCLCNTDCTLTTQKGNSAKTSNVFCFFVCKLSNFWYTICCGINIFIRKKYTIECSNYSRKMCSPWILFTWNIGSSRLIFWGPIYLLQELMTTCSLLRTPVLRFHYKYQAPNEYVKRFIRTIWPSGSYECFVVKWFPVCKLVPDYEVVDENHWIWSFILLLLYFLNYLISRIQLQCSFCHE